MVCGNPYAVPDLQTPYPRLRNYDLPILMGSESSDALGKNLATRRPWLIIAPVLYFVPRKLSRSNGGLCMKTGVILQPRGIMFHVSMLFHLDSDGTRSPLVNNSTNCYSCRTLSCQKGPILVMLIT